MCDRAKAQCETRDYLKHLTQYMKRAVDDMVDLQKAIDSVDQPAWRHLANYDQLKGGNASRVYLELEMQ